MRIGAPEPIAALNRVKILETGEPLVDIRDFCPEVQVREDSCSYLRRTVAEMLNRAQKNLPPGHCFRVGTALRTLRMQKRGWDSYFQRMKEEHPAWPLSALRRATNRFFAPYDQPAPPGHCTGGAVDVALVGPDGELIDVSSPLEGWDAAYTWTDRLTPQAKANRMILVHAMLDAGFSNCREEYWHYSWGDSAWAVRVGEKTCPYGLVEPPVAVEARFSGALAAEIRKTGAAEWTCRPLSDPPASTPPESDSPEPAPETPSLLIGLFWSFEKPLTIRIEPPIPSALFLSEDRERWEAVTAERAGDLSVLTLAPSADRVFLKGIV